MKTQQSFFKNEKNIYYTALVFVSCWFLTSGILEITRHESVWLKTIRMGYPPYFILLLGYLKITGVAVLLLPKNLNPLKEWVFAGLFFDVIFAAVSGYHLGNRGGVLIPVVALILILFTYFMFRRVFFRTTEQF